MCLRQRFEAHKSVLDITKAQVAGLTAANPAANSMLQRFLDESVIYAENVVNTTGGSIEDTIDGSVETSARRYPNLSDKGSCLVSPDVDDAGIDSSHDERIILHKPSRPGLFDRPTKRNVRWGIAGYQSSVDAKEWLSYAQCVGDMSSATSSCSIADLSMCRGARTGELTQVALTHGAQPCKKKIKEDSVN